MNIIVAGASRGIGREIVKKFSVEGNNRIIILARNKARLESLMNEVAEIGPRCEVIPMPFDFASGNFELLGEFVQDRFEYFDSLVYCSGLLVNKPFKELLSEDLDAMYNTNLKGYILLVQTLLKLNLLRENTHLVSIGSMGGFQGSAKFPGLSMYSATKGALAILSECLAEELSEAGIKSNCLAIGAVQTEMLSEAFPGYQAPLSPDEMAEYIVEFVKTGHRFYNGKILPVSVSTP